MSGLVLAAIAIFPIYTLFHIQKKRESDCEKIAVQLNFLKDEDGRVLTCESFQRSAHKSECMDAYLWDKQLKKHGTSYAFLLQDIGKKSNCQIEFSFISRFGKTAYQSAKRWVSLEVENALGQNMEIYRGHRRYGLLSNNSE